MLLRRRMRRMDRVSRVSRIVHMQRNNRVRNRTKRALFYSRGGRMPSCPVAAKPRGPLCRCNAARAVAGRPS
ncbi:hypothetical protein BZL54_33030 [Burkholderia ubonensis subsp. mesacidophila]|uniref:Uncharacterized protein n=1 Tax=Burkholderia ubonensis subsp. mesacidophila TaxID=265293 RepID=A0A2A4ET95_9BURK|nr:hypothetical protein BZL54_33030 [Burkholderia ubonensis subsp. mesacidophila]